jgi:outer membrane protein TolC
LLAGWFQAAVTKAAAEAYRPSLLRFKVGVGTFLSALLDQQTLYSARRREVDLAALDLRNRVTLAPALALL